MKWYILPVSKSISNLDTLLWTTCVKCHNTRLDQIRIVLMMRVSFFFFDLPEKFHLRVTMLERNVVVKNGPKVYFFPVIKPKENNILFTARSYTLFMSPAFQDAPGPCSPKRRPNFPQRNFWVPNSEPVMVRCVKTQIYSSCVWYMYPKPCSCYSSALN